MKGSSLQKNAGCRNVDRMMDANHFAAPGAIQARTLNRGCNTLAAGQRAPKGRIAPTGKADLSNEKMCWEPSTKSPSSAAPPQGSQAAAVTAPLGLSILAEKAQPESNHGKTGLTNPRGKTLA